MEANNPIKVLMDEHDIISSTEEIILSLDGLCSTNSVKYKETVLTLLNFFSNYSDAYHHFKEEKILFPELINHPDFMQSEIIRELEEHHELFREYLKDIRETLEHEDYQKSLILLKQYCNDLLDHIAVENDELFIMAETVMNENILENIYFKFMDIDAELGMQKKKDLVCLLNDLKENTIV